MRHWPSLIGWCATSEALSRAAARMIVSSSMLLGNLGLIDLHNVSHKAVAGFAARDFPGCALDDPALSYNQHMPRSDSDRGQHDSPDLMFQRCCSRIVGCRLFRHN